MDDLAIVIKTKIELDEKQARAELDSLSKSLSGDNSAAKIKIKIGVDEKADYHQFHLQLQKPVLEKTKGKI